MGRVFYSGSIHDEAEIAAVTEVLRGGPDALKLGVNVEEFERRVAELSGKRFGVMCNSGSSALYLAFELADLPAGSEVLTSVLTFSTDVSPIVRAGLIPVFVDVEPDTFNVDVDALEAMIGPDTRAVMMPNLVGNAPDWDRIREIADRHGLLVIEDSCDALGATLRGTPTGTRSDISVTSFAVPHIITCAGNGGMVFVDDERMRDRAVLLRRWGRRSELHFFGSRKGQRDLYEDLDGVRYDNMFIFDELGWNLEPSELGAAFGLAQLDKLPRFLQARRRSFAAHQEFFGSYPDTFVPPRQLEDLDTAWLQYPLLLVPDEGFTRTQFQEYLEDRGIDVRGVFSGNVTRQPMMKNVQVRAPEAGFPNADHVTAHGVMISNGHGLTDEMIAYLHRNVAEFLDRRS